LRVTELQVEFPTQEPKSVVFPSPVMLVDGNVTAVPLHPPVTLHDTASVNFTADPLGVDAVAGLIETLAEPPASAAVAEPAMLARRARHETIAAETGREPQRMSTTSATQAGSLTDANDR
jgi:hypothetical protein